MKKNLSDEKLLELLRGLPREKAPENFEFNLISKIKNKNFGNLEKDENPNFLWIIIPSASIVTAAVLILVFMFSSIEENASLQSIPQKITSKKAETYVVIKQEKNMKKDEIEAIKIVKAENDAVSKQKIVIPINKNEELPIDNFLNKSVKGKSSSATLVSSEEKSPFEFRGFLPYSPAQEKKEKRDSVSLK